jgi:hypothetical protein
MQRVTSAQLQTDRGIEPCLKNKLTLLSSMQSYQSPLLHLIIKFGCALNAGLSGI